MAIPTESAATTATTFEAPESRQLQTIFEATARRHGDRLAVVCGDTRWTYAELDALANRFARWLQSQGVGRETCVPLWLPRGPLQALAQLATLKAGGAYVPLDAEFPGERVAAAATDCGATLLLTHSTKTPPRIAATPFALDELIDRLDAYSPESINEDSAGERPADRSRDLAYVIYTSGTTGRPKGVEIEHRSVVHLIEVERRLFGVGPHDVVWQGFSPAFDASVEETWLAFAAGAALVVATADELHDAPSLPRRLREQGVTVVSTSPTMLSLWNEDIPSLRLLISGGEALPNETVKRWLRPGRRVVNTYGPTEATVIATAFECEPGREVSLGRPIEGYRTQVVRADDVPCAVDEPGELLLGGAGLARGYRHLPELTASKFIELAEPDGSRARWYRTGDLVQKHSDGSLAFLGRVDDQIKLRGFRIELGEIERTLAETPGVGAAAAKVVGEGEAARIVAYVTPRQDAAYDVFATRRILRAKLPPYMQPASIQLIERLPLTTTGKLDRRALPDPTSLPDAIDDGRTIRPPESATERALWNACERIFAPAQVSMDDDFFMDLGGHSLTAARLANELRATPEWSGLSMLDIYQAPRLHELAARFASRASSPTPRAESAAPGARIFGLRHFLCGVGQLLAMYGVAAFVSLQWLSPYLAFNIARWEGLTALESIACAGAALTLVYPAMLAIGAVAKWTLLGRVQPGSYRLWGWFHLRWWLVRSLLNAAPRGYLAGTPLLNAYLRLLGARIGRDVFLASDAIDACDVIEIGDGASIGPDVSLLGARVADGFIHIAPIRVGRDCAIDSRCSIGPGATIEDGARLEPLSMIPPGTVVPRGETWGGSPARKIEQPAERPTRRTSPTGDIGWTNWRSFVSATAGVAMFPLIFLLGTAPGMIIMYELNDWDFAGYSHLILAPAVALLFLATLATEITVFKWLLLGRVVAGDYPIHGGFYWRKWFVDRLMDMSLDVLGPIYSTIYLAPWYRTLGAKVGRGAEVSTASFISPDLLQVEEDAFVADIVSLGAPRFDRGWMTLGEVRIGARSFVGNSAVVSPGTNLPERSLVGCFSLAPRTSAVDSNWLGSPAFSLPRRAVSTEFPDETTFRPSISTRWTRAAIHFLRAVLPTTGFVAMTNVLLGESTTLESIGGWPLVVAAFPLLYLVGGIGAAAFVVAVKWIVMGRYRPCEKPLYASFVSLSEMTTGLYEHLAVPALLGSLQGTPFLPWALRLFGARFGRRVYCDTVQFTEFDLVDVGDETELNSDATLQTHLFEDRVMKMSHVRIGARCSVGAESLVLYDSQMADGSSLGELSLLMKGETLPERTAWAGIPARPEIAASA